MTRTNEDAFRELEEMLDASIREQYPAAISEDGTVVLTPGQQRELEERGHVWLWYDGNMHMIMSTESHERMKGRINDRHTHQPHKARRLER